MMKFDSKEELLGYMEEYRDDWIVEKECAGNLNMDWDTINTCWTGDEGIALAQKDADKGDAIKEAYGKQGLPLVWVDGRLMTHFWECDASKAKSQEALLTAICDASTATELPEACAQVGHLV